MFNERSSFTRGGANKFDEPDPLAPPKEKEGKEYGVRMAKFLWHNYHNYNTGIFYNNRARYNQLIAYAQGNQGVDRYKQLAYADDGTDNSWINIDWKIRNYATKRVGIVKSMLEKDRLKLNLQAVDPYSSSVKIEYENKQKTAIMLTQIMDEVKADSVENPFAKDTQFQSIEELEMHMTEDYQHAWAKDMEIANEYIMEVANDYERIMQMNAFDLTTIGIASVLTRNGKNGYPEIEYVDPAELIVPASRYEDFQDITKMGRVKEMSLTELRKMAGTQFTETEYREIKENLVYNNQKTAQYENAEPQQRLKSPYENNRVRVMDFYFTSTIEDVYEVKIDDMGRSVMRKTSQNKGKGKSYKTVTGENGVTYRQNEDGTKRIYRDKYEVLYRGYWIVDSDYIFSYGLSTNMSRDFKNLNKVDIPIK